MTASSLAHLLHGRRYKRGCWKARCPVHQEKTASLSIREGKYAILVHCFGCGADGEAVMKALGLPTRQLFYSTEVSPQIRQQISEEHYLERLHRRLGLMDMLHYLEPANRRYWAKAIEGCEQDIIRLHRKLYPDKPLISRLRGVRKCGPQIVGKVWDAVRDDPDRRTW